MKCGNKMQQYSKGADMPSDYLSRNVLSSINVFSEDIPRLQALDNFCSSIQGAFHSHFIYYNSRENYDELPSSHLSHSLAISLSFFGIPT